MMKKKYGQTYLFLLLFFLYVCSLFHRTEYGRCSVKAEEIEEAQGINEKREVEELSSTQSIEVSLEEEKQALEAIELYSKGLEATVQLNDRLLAIEYYYRAIQTYPKLVGAYVNLGILLQAIGEIEKSFEILLKGAQMAEEVKDLNNLASIYNNLGFVERHINPNSVQHCLQAIKYFEKGLEANPNLIDLLYNKASALIYLRKFIEAEQIFEKILSIDPHHDGAHLDLGNIWYQRGDLERAIQHQDHVIKYSTNQVSVNGALHNKGQFLKDKGFHGKALEIHLEALRQQPNNALALSSVIIAKRTLCQWDHIEELHDLLIELTLKEFENSQIYTPGQPNVIILPYDSTLLRLTDAFRKQLTVSYMKKYNQPQTLTLLPLRPIIKSGNFEQVIEQRKLRIGYLSFDFRDHPMGQLTIGPIESHDTNRIEHYCFSYGRNDGSEWRKRTEKACVVFRDLLLLPDIEAASRIALDEVDILIDLMAHTKGTRIGITSLKPSRIIVNYLGFPGTMGSSFTDFAIVDHFIVPPEKAQQTMTEKLVYLPHAYQTNQHDLYIDVCNGSPVDAKEEQFLSAQACQHQNRSIAFEISLQMTNQALLDDFLLFNKEILPINDPKTFVFCNFNTIDKMEPIMFHVWMSILHRVPNSVLWLLQPLRGEGKTIQRILLQEAQARGIFLSRILFAPKKHKTHHLNRLKHADLFLDSLIYNAHTTASDALWTNLPILTFHGDTFPSRVAASLIQQAFGKETQEADVLIASSLKEYEDLAVLLATNKRQLLMPLRYELSKRVSIVTPLFDTKRITNHLETAYEVIYEVKQGQNKHFHLLIDPQDARVSNTTANTKRRLQVAMNQALVLQQSETSESQVQVLEFSQRIYKRILQVEPKDTNILHRLGIVSYQQQKYPEAIDFLTQAIEISPTNALFYMHRGIVYAEMNASSSAIQDLIKVIEMDITKEIKYLSNPEAFIKLTWIFEQQENYQAIVDLYGQYGNVLLNTDVSEFEKERSLLQWSYALSRMNQNLVAIDLLTQAFELFPFFFRVGYNLVALLDSVGKYEEEEIILEKNVIAEHRFLFETKGKSIVKVPRPRHRAIVVLYCYEYGQTWWDEWGPSSLKKGLGGSEEAVLFLSRELSQLGYWVEIYGNPSVEDQGKDEYGVLWYPHYAFNHNDQDVDIFIAWRYYISLLLGQSARLRYFWIHDIPSANLLQSQKILPLAHGILCVSNFQAQQFTKEVDKWASRLFVTSNGLDPKYFRDGPNFLTHFVYGSSPNRGLYHILKAWPRIRAFIPEAQLTVYYGFTPAFLRWARRKMPSFETWKKEMDNMLTQPGVKYIGLVDHEELAKGYANAGFSLYPTTFSETSCVSLMKAMANGAIPITSRYVASALSETCDEFDLGPSTPVQSEQELVAPNSQWITSWIENIVMAVQNVQETQALRKKMKEFARKRYQWSNVALQWHGIFRRGLASSSTTTTITS